MSTVRSTTTHAASTAYLAPELDQAGLMYTARQFYTDCHNGHVPCPGRLSYDIHDLALIES
jgi:hypothetical protein